MDATDVALARAFDEIARLGEQDEDEPKAPDPRRAGRAGYREAVLAWHGPRVRNTRRARARAVVASRKQPKRDKDADGCVVETAPLCGLLEDFVTGWRRTRPSRKGQWEATADDEPMGPYEYIAEKTRLPESLIRRVRNVARYPLTELRVADALVASIGDPSMFQGDEPLLRILPNPAAPPARRAECCGGSESLTGC